MSILKSLSHKLVYDPLGATVFAAVVSSSYFICANFGIANFGIMPAIQAPDGVELPVATKVALWKWFYDHARNHFVLNAMASAFLFAIASTITAPTSFSGLLLCASLMSFSILPFTGAVVIPVNNELEGLRKSGQLQTSSKLPKSVEDDRALQALDKLEELHRVKLALGAGAWVLGLVALVVCM